MRTLLVVFASALMFPTMPVTGPESPVALRAATTLSVSDLTLSPGTGGTQTIHIAGDTTQDIEFDTGALSPAIRSVTRQGGSCTTRVCGGTGDVTITYLYPESGNVDTLALNGQDVKVTASTPDFASATGTVMVRYLADLKLAASYSAFTTTAEWVYINWSANGPDPAMNPVLRIPALGVVCTIAQPGPCTLMEPNYLIQLPIPVCQAFKPLDLCISSDSADPDPTNNTVHIEPVGGSPALVGCAPSSSGGGGGGSSSGSSGGGATPTIAPLMSTTPSATVDAASTPAAGPTTAIVAANATSVLARPVSDERGSNRGWLIAAITVVGLGVLGGLRGLWLRRRRAGATDA